MIAYNLYLPPAGQSDQDTSAIKFLADTNSWVAAFVPPLWLLWHRLWWALGVYFAYSLVIFLLALTSWVDTAVFLSALPGIYLFLEGNELIRQKYEAIGWTGAGVVHASNLEDAETRYFNREPAQVSDSQSKHIETMPTLQASSPIPGAHKKPVPAGLFPMDGTDG